MLSQRPLSLLGAWREGLLALRHGLPASLIVALIAILLPHTIFQAYSSVRGSQVADEILAHYQTASTFLEILNPASTFLTQYLTLMFATWLLSGLGFTLLVSLASRDQAPTAWVPFIVSKIRPTLVIVFFEILSLLIAAALAQFALILAFSFLALSFMFPAVLLSKPVQKGNLATFWHTLKLEYVHPDQNFGKFSIFLVLLSTLASAYGIMLLFEFTASNVLFLDRTLAINAEIWRWRFESLSFGWIYLISLLIRAMGSAVAISLLAGLSVGLLRLVQQTPEQLSRAKPSANP